MTAIYEVFALRYAHFADRTQGQNFIFPDDHAAAMPIDFYVWAVRGEGRTIVLDTGFDAASAARRSRQWLRSPLDALRGIGIDPAKVDDVVLSHMHWDHAGHWDAFPNARFHLQEAEMAYCTGRCMCHEPLRRAFDVEHVQSAVAHVFRSVFAFMPARPKSHRASPCTSLAAIPAVFRSCACPPRAAPWFSRPMQRISGPTSASETLPLLHNLERMIEGWVTCETLADGPDHIIPGHDPEVLRRFPPVPGQEGTVRVDRPPLS